MPNQLPKWNAQLEEGLGLREWPTDLFLNSDFFFFIRHTTAVNPSLSDQALKPPSHRSSLGSHPLSAFIRPHLSPSSTLSAHSLLTLKSKTEANHGGEIPSLRCMPKMRNKRSEWEVPSGNSSFLFYQFFFFLNSCCNFLYGSLLRKIGD